MKSQSPYVLITPTKNEQAFIRATIQSVVNQTIRPAEWIIVNDGSTDQTEEIVRAAGVANPWIRLLTLPNRAERNFAALVHATEAGVQMLTDQSYKYIGLLDSDIRFPPEYFWRVIERFESTPTLGLAGGLVVDVGLPQCALPRNRLDVPGAVQFFRRTCFEALGGLLAIPEGGWDALTCARARMLGFETRLFTDLVVDHLKPRNVSEGNILRRTWQMGVRDNALGYHPLFEGIKCLGRVCESPPLVGSLARWLGYCFAAFQSRERLIPPDLRRFIRREQTQRLSRSLNPFG